MKPPCASILPECRSPPRGFATACPCACARCRQRIALDTLTPNRVAAARQLRPPSIAATTLSRRSCESARAIYASLLSPAQCLNHNKAAKGIPIDSVRVETALVNVTSPVQDHCRRSLDDLVLEGCNGKWS